MTCILKNCAHGSLGACKTFARSGLGECGAEYVLELASRNDGYMVHGRNNPTIEALRKAGKITTAAVDDRYVIARAVHIPHPPYRGYCTPGYTRAVQIGHGINLKPPIEETFA